MKKSWFLLLLLNTFWGYSQEKESWFDTHIDLNGYINYSNILIFHNADDLSTNNLWHNRINLEYFINDHILFKTGMRNRVYYGEWLKNPLLRFSLQKDDGIFNLTHSFIDKKNLFEVSNIDRLLLDINLKKWEVIIGRQRINWGMNSVWNPTDIFNTANFLDLDYPEKPGTDALRLSYDINGMSTIDMAFSSNAHFDKNENIWAVRYTNSIKSNDFQIQIGYYKDYFYSGLGWAGNLKNMGLKTEAGIFSKNHSSSLIASFETDYAFRNGTYWVASVLYNGKWEDSVLQTSFFTGQNLDVMHLFPAKWAFYNQFNGNLGPAWTWSFGAVYGNQNQLIILIPSLQHNLSNNWDIDLFMQSFFADIPGTKQTNMLNFRIKYHF